MKVTVRQRKYRDRVAWSADIHVVPAGEQATERFRIAAPSTVTSRSGAERWAMEQARRIAAHGRPVIDDLESMPEGLRPSSCWLSMCRIHHSRSMTSTDQDPQAVPDSPSAVARIWKCATGAALERGGAARAVPPR